MMLPILISVSVAPVSYFFWARAPVEEAANRASAVEAMAKRVAITGIRFSLNFLMLTCRGFLDRKALLIWRENYHFARNGTTKSPCGNAAGAASLVVRRVE